MTHQKKNGISNSIIGSTITGGSTIVGENNTVTYSQTIQSINPEEIPALIKKMQEIIQFSDLPETPKNKCDLHLQTIAEEAQEQEPDRVYAAKTINKLLYVLKNSDITSGSKDILQKKLQPLIIKMHPWLGENKKFLVL